METVAFNCGWREYKLCTNCFILMSNFFFPLSSSKKVYWDAIHASSLSNFKNQDNVENFFSHQNKCFFFFLVHLLIKFTLLIIGQLRLALDKRVSIWTCVFSLAVEQLHLQTCFIKFISGRKVTLTLVLFEAVSPIPQLFCLVTSFHWEMPVFIHELIEFLLVSASRSQKI